MYRTEDSEDLRGEIYHLKKQLGGVTSENQLLKVKVRKLQNELARRDKQIDIILDPRQSSDTAGKIFYERSATFLMNMKDHNEKLSKMVQEKDFTIRRLQTQLEMTKLYSQPYPPKKEFQLQEPNNRTPKKASQSTLSHNILPHDGTCRSKTTTSKNLDLKEQYKSLSRDHLLSIIENLKTNQRYSSPIITQSRPMSSSRKSSPESDLDRIELLCESPHEEVQQLHLHFLEMISEVDYLKSTIMQLQNNQEKTDNVLRNKDDNLDKLAQEIENLKRPKNRLLNSANRKEAIAKIYRSSSAGAVPYQNNHHKKQRNQRNNFYANNRSCCNSNNSVKTIRNKKRNNKVSKKDITTQVEIVEEEDEDEPKGTFGTTYVKKDSVVIRAKSTSKATKMDEYLEDFHSDDDDADDEKGHEKICPSEEEPIDS